jgi:DNA polymerase-3 subunit alpha
MTLWAENATGLRNLMALSSLAYSEGLFGKHARTDLGRLAEHSDGIIATTGCPSGAVPTLLRLGLDKRARDYAGNLVDIFGKDNLYVELMDHGLTLESRIKPGLVKLAGELNLQFVVTNDCHYVSPSDAHAHDMMLCVQTGSKLTDKDRFRFSGPDRYYLTDAEEMAPNGYAEQWLAGLQSTIDIAERIDTTGMFSTGGMFFPSAKVPSGRHHADFLANKARRALSDLFGSPSDLLNEYAARLEYELKVINDAGFTDYILVVADLIDWAHRNGISTSPGRGSAAGSLVAYVLGITQIDPIRYGLVFERFLNPERISMPDIDIDFDDRRRLEVLDYCASVYGTDHVSQIATFSTIKPKAAIRDAARVLGAPYSLGDSLSKMVPPELETLWAVDDSGTEQAALAKELRAAAKGDPMAKQVIAGAQQIEGLVRQAGVHAAGVIISSEPITHVVPTWRRATDTTPITQFDYRDCEALGLVKMDFLGLRTLTVISDTLASIKRRTGKEIDINNIPLDDAKSFCTASSGDTLGVFQFESRGMRELLTDMRPTSITDLATAVAIYRPGPISMGAHTQYVGRKRGVERIEPLHPEVAEALKPVLAETFGLVVFQEQVLQIARVLAGFTLGAADVLRKAMGKKDIDVLESAYAEFYAGCEANGYSEAAIKAVWETILPFTGYAFNKAHATAYATLAYQTLWLKTHYRADFMAAVLSSVADDTTKLSDYLAGCRSSGLRILPPSVAESQASFTALSDDAVAFGLAAIKGVGDKAVAALIESREDRRFTSLVNLVERSIPGVNQATLKALAKAGAFDCLGIGRYGALRQLAITGMRTVAAPDWLVLDWEQPTPAEFEPPQAVALRMEREALGVYASGHPLEALGATLRPTDGTAVSQLPTIRNGGSVVWVGALVDAISIRTRRNGDPWAALTVEDLSGRGELVAHSEAWKELANVVHVGGAYHFQGQVQLRGDRTAISIRQAKPVAVPEAPATPLPVSKPKYSPGAPGLVSTIAGTIQVRSYASV